MQKCVGEIHRIPGRVTVLAVLQVARNDGGKLRIVKETMRQRIKQRCEVTDRGTPQKAAGTQNAMRLAQAGQTVGWFNEMIKRSKQQNRIGGLIGVDQNTRVSDFCRGQRMLWLSARGLTGLLHVLGHRINQVHLIAESGQPAGIHASPASGVDDGRRSRWQVAKNQFPSARLLELKPSTVKARGLVHLLVMLNNTRRG